MGRINPPHRRREQMRHLMLESPDEYLLQFTADILDKQYRNYQEIDVKVGTLLTINGVLLAGTILILKDLPGIYWWEDVIAMVGLALMFCSLVLGLLHALPDISSGVSRDPADPNPRTINGVQSFAAKESYWAHLVKASPRKMAQYNAFQIFGLSRNTLRRVRRLKYAGRFTLSGALCRAIAFSSWSGRRIAGEINPTWPQKQGTISSKQKIPMSKVTARPKVPPLVPAKPTH